MNVLDFQKMKDTGKRISVLTCYDVWSARLLADSPVDALLVGDSVITVIHGEQHTLAATVGLMELHTRAVARGAGDKFIIADMPFLSFRKGISPALDAAGALMAAGAHAVKLEGVLGHEDVIERLVQSGIPVMGHLGLTPQSEFGLGGLQVQGRGEAASRQLLEHAKLLERLGCFSVVLECIPARLAGVVTDELKIPTIGIGAGSAVSGQVLVLHDMLGLNPGFSPKFLRTWLTGSRLIQEAVTRFDNDVKNGTYPDEGESYQ